MNIQLRLPLPLAEQMQEETPLLSTNKGKAYRNKSVARNSTNEAFKKKIFGEVDSDAITRSLDDKLSAIKKADASKILLNQKVATHKNKSMRMPENSINKVRAKLFQVQ